VVLEDASRVARLNDLKGVCMIDGSFDHRTLANMEVALDRVCARSSRGDTHEVRKRVAGAIVRCARSGKTTLGALTEAGERVRVARGREKLAKSA